MDSFKREACLLPPLREYARRQKFSWQDAEVPFYEYRIDFYAFSEKLQLTVAVELKLRNWKRAVEQALLYQLCADRVYIAVPRATSVRVDIDELLSHGIGMIAVDFSGRCRRIVCPKPSSVMVPDYRKTYIEMLKRVA